MAFPCESERLVDRYSKHDRVNEFGCEIYFARFEMYLYFVTCSS